MTEETSDIVLGVLILAVALPVLYFVAQLIIKIQNAWSARVLSPLATMMDKDARLTDGAIQGHYQGCQLRAYYAKNKSDTWDSENSIGFDAFYIVATDISGKCDWIIKFHVSGLLGQGPKQLRIHTSDKGLGERLTQAGVMDAVAKVSAPSEDYVTVTFDARSKSLTYIDDVSPKRVPSPKQFSAQLDLVVRLVEINTRVNQNF